MKTPVAHQLSMTVLMTPDMANFSGNVHGGHILKLLDQVAYACASRYAQGYVVATVLPRATPARVRAGAPVPLDFRSVSSHTSDRNDRTLFTQVSIAVDSQIEQRARSRM